MAEKSGELWSNHGDDATLFSRDTASSQPSFHLGSWDRIRGRLWRRRRHSISKRLHVLPSTSQRKWTALWMLSKTVLFMIIVFIMSSIWKGLSSPSYTTPPQRYLDLDRQVRTSTNSGRGNLDNEKVFIAANIVNEDLIRGTWGNNLLSLVDLLGEDNVFVSIYENDSGTGTSDALRQLQQRLRCNSSIVTGDHVPLSDFPKTRLPSGEERVQRLTYLSEIRNRLLRPIDPSYQDISSNGFRKATDIKFDRVLFLNDVYYSPLEAVQLLFSTNAASGSAQYRAACALDFVQFFKLYDTFVVRDTDGYRAPLQFFPWFTHRGTGTSRADVLSLTDAVRVRSCWGGMAAFDAAMFQPQSSLKSHNLQPETASLSLKFRSDGEPFWEAAECCLIFADMEDKFGKPSSSDHSGVFVNPYIRTAYSSTTWNWLSFFRRFDRVLENFQTIVDYLIPIEDNPRRTHEPGQLVNEVVWVGSNTTSLRTSAHYREVTTYNRYGHFEVQHHPARTGGFCGQRRMFVMKSDVEAANKDHGGRNWKKIPVPSHCELSHH